jgi:hypothetical protein
VCDLAGSSHRLWGWRKNKGVSSPCGDSSDTYGQHLCGMLRGEHVKTVLTCI